MHSGREPEYVCGQLLERPTPNRTHGEIVAALVYIFMSRLQAKGFRAATEVRCQMPNGNYRLPDIVLFAPDHPWVELPSHPPAVVVQVLSNDDKYSDIFAKLEDYELWGVAHIWLVNPNSGTLQTFETGSLRRVESLTIPEYGLEIRYDDIAPGG
jgi:Uma2 family endonuclease